MTKLGHIFEVIYLGDLYVFFVNADLQLVKVEKRSPMIPPEIIDFSALPDAIKHDFIEQCLRHGIA